MSNAGTALMGIGSGNGPDRAKLAAQRAVASPLLECDLVAATGAVFNIVGGPDMTLGEITAASEIIEAAMDPEVGQGQSSTDYCRNSRGKNKRARNFDTTRIPPSTGKSFPGGFWALGRI